MPVKLNKRKNKKINIKKNNLIVWIISLKIFFKIEIIKKLILKKKSIIKK
jgi:hypothetical protein